MREFSDSEKEIMKQIDALKDGSFGNFQSSKLIRNNIDLFAVRWDEKGVYIYSKNQDVDKYSETFFKICDLLYFLEELERCNFIRVQSLITDVNSVTIDDDKYIAPENYEYNAEMDQFYLREENLRKFSPQSIDNTRTDIVKLLGRYAYCKFIYPLPLLRDYVKHDFKSIERRNFEKQMEDANTKHEEQMKCEKKALRVSQRSFVIALITLLISVPVNVATCLSSKEKENTEIGSTRNRSAIIDKASSDTIKSIVIEEKRSSK